jgi:hypothetical protein
VSQPRTAVEIAQSLSTARRLVAVGAERVRQTLLDLDVAKIAIAEIEQELAVSGVASSEAPKGAKV